MIKVYVNGFKIDDVETSELALTNIVKETIGDRKIILIQPAPIANPKAIMIYTEL